MIVARYMIFMVHIGNLRKYSGFNINRKNYRQKYWYISFLLCRFKTVNEKMADIIFENKSLSIYQRKKLKKYENDKKYKKYEK